MDEVAFFILLGLLMLVALILGPIGFFLGRGQARRIEHLEKSVLLLSDKVRDLGPTSTIAHAVRDDSVSDALDEQPLEEVESDDSLNENDSPAIPEPDSAPEPDLVQPEPSEDIPWPPPIPEEAAQPSDTWEKLLGGRWAVWAGGFALALGGIFLARYSIEEGLLSPATRLLLGFLFSLVLLGVGEWTRRRETQFSISGFEQANIPATLTAAGIIGAFAAAYAAHAVFGFIGPTLALIVMAAVSLLALVAALLHGPALAAIGLLASFAAPFLVSSTAPSPLPFAVYGLFAGAASMVIARWRLWRWLAIGASVGMLLYIPVLHGMDGAWLRIILGLYTAATLAIVLYVFVISFGSEESDEESEPSFANTIDLPTTGLAGLFVLSTLANTRWDGVDLLTFIELAIVLAIGFGIAAYYFRVRYLAPLAAVVVTLRLLGINGAWEKVRQANAIADQIALSDATNLFQVVDVLPYLAIIALLSGGLLALSWHFATRTRSIAVIASSAVAFSLMGLAIAWARIDAFAMSFNFFLAAMALTGLFTVMTLRLERLAGVQQEVNLPLEGAIAAFVTGTFAALALGVSMVLEKGFLTIALALIVAAMGYVFRTRPLPGLHATSIALMLVWCLRVAANPAIVDGELGTTPIFNWLTYGWGVSSAAFVTACYFFRDAPNRRFLQIMEAMTIAIVTTTLALIAVHTWDPTEVLTEPDTLAEFALLTMVGAGVSLGLLHLRGGSTRVASLATDALGYLGMAIALLVLIGFMNPIFTGERVGTGLIFNQLTLAYLLPAILFAVIGWRSWHRRPYPYPHAALGTAGLLGFTWVSLLVRQAFHPDKLNAGVISNAELYTYSAIWLLVACAVIAVGFWLRVKLLRQTALGLLLLVILKVFFIDMSNLTGIWRALSFIGLGAILVSIGLVYQRLQRRLEEEEPAPEGSTNDE